MARSPVLVRIVFAYGPRLEGSQQDCQCCRRVAPKPFSLPHASLEQSQWLACTHFIQRQALDHTLSGQPPEMGHQKCCSLCMLSAGAYLLQVRLVTGCCLQ